MPEPVDHPRSVWGVLRCAATHWFRDDPATAGAAIAFYCVISLAPLLVIMLTILGKILGDDRARRQLGVQLAALFGPATGTGLMNAASSAQHTSGALATVVSAVALLIGATTVLASLESALRRIWQSDALASNIWGWVRTRLLSFGIILALGFLLVVSLTVSTAMATLRSVLADRYPVVVPTLGAIDLVLSLTLVAGLFSLVYALLPTKRLPWRAIVTGALITALLFDLGRLLIGIYLAHSIEATAFGAAASFAALLLWLYYSAQIFLFGAQLTACLGGLRLPKQPAP